jgi:ABC-type polysaccharide/polyol phosphate export systems, permease component
MPKGVVYMFILKSLNVFKNYLYLLQQLVSRDFKIKYKRSVLGVLWSVLNPLLTMLILYVVFSAIFVARSSYVHNFSAYLLIGIILFNFFNETTSLSLGAIVLNFNLITKVSMPKYIFPLSKILSTAFNFLFSLIALYLIVIIQVILGMLPFNWTQIFIPYDLVCMLMFLIGIGLMLSALTVFFRDMNYIWGVVTMAWMYFTPIMYPLQMIEEYNQWWTPAIVTIMKINPLYQFINFARTIILYGAVPTGFQFLYVFAWGVVMLTVGVLFFRSKQDKFIYYI